MLHVSNFSQRKKNPLYEYMVIRSSIYQLMDFWVVSNFFLLFINLL